MVVLSVRVMTRLRVNDKQVPMCRHVDPYGRHSGVVEALTGFEAVLLEGVIDGTRPRVDKAKLWEVWRMR